MISSPSADKTADKDGAGAVGESRKLFVLCGAPGEIRTPDLLIRSQPLYPTELRAHATVDFSRKLPLRHHRIDQPADAFHLHRHFVSRQQPPRRLARETYAGRGPGGNEQFEIKHNDFAKAMRKVDPTINPIAGGAMPDAMAGSKQAKRINGQIVPDYLSVADGAATCWRTVWTTSTCSANTTTRRALSA